MKSTFLRRLVALGWNAWSGSFWRAVPSGQRWPYLPTTHAIPAGCPVAGRENSSILARAPRGNRHPELSAIAKPLARTDPNACILFIALALPVRQPRPADPPDAIEAERISSELSMKEDCFRSRIRTSVTNLGFLFRGWRQTLFPVETFRFQHMGTASLRPAREDESLHLAADFAFSINCRSSC